MSRHHDALSITVLHDPSGMFDAGASFSYVSVEFGVRDATLPNGILLLYEPERGIYANSCKLLLYYNCILWNVTVPGREIADIVPADISAKGIEKEVINETLF